MQGWPRTFEQARAVQETLRTQVRLGDDLGCVLTVAGVDAGYEGDTAHAAVVVLSFPGLEVVDYAVARRKVRFPYVPGYLSFRETPAVLQAIESLRVRPSLLICDGAGIAHPRRFGLACHLGILADLPSIGCAKSRLVGEHGEPGPERGSEAPLVDRGEVVGAVVRTRAGVKPLYVSQGHRVSLASAVRYVLACTTRYRLPETTRAADGLASRGRVPEVGQKGG